MEELITMIVNNGIGIVCVAYLIYFQNSTMKDINKTLDNINVNLTILSTKLEQVEKKG